MDAEHFRPVFEHWRMQPALKVWEVAFLMHGFEPRLRSDIPVLDQENPASYYGAEPDISDEVRMLADAVRVGDLDDVSEKPGTDEERLISAAGLLPWLSAHGFEELARELHGYSAAGSAASASLSKRAYVPRQRAQEDTIIAEIVNQKLDPRSLPPRGRESGVKKAVWDVVASHPEFTGRRGVFDKAWERLRADGRIIGGK